MSEHDNSTHHYIAVADNGQTAGGCVSTLLGADSWPAFFARVMAELCPEIDQPSPVSHLRNPDRSLTLHIASKVGDDAWVPKRFVVFHTFNCFDLPADIDLD